MEIAKQIIESSIIQIFGKEALFKLKLIEGLEDYKYYGIHFPRVSIKNGSGREHIITNFLAVLVFTPNYHLHEIQGMRVTVTKAEYDSNYIHTHVLNGGRNRDSFKTIGGFCLGNTRINKVKAILSTGVSEQAMLELCRLLPTTVSWEEEKGHSSLVFNNVREGRTKSYPTNILSIQTELLSKVKEEDVSKMHLTSKSCTIPLTIGLRKLFATFEKQEHVCFIDDNNVVRPKENNTTFRYDLVKMPLGTANGRPIFLTIRDATAPAVFEKAKTHNIEVASLEREALYLKALEQIILKGHKVLINKKIKHTYENKNIRNNRNPYNIFNFTKTD